MLVNALKLPRLSNIDTEELTREQWKEMMTTQLNKNKMLRMLQPGKRKIKL